MPPPPGRIDSIRPGFTPIPEDSRAPVPIATTDILAARQRLAGRIRRTPLAASASLSIRAGRPVLLKHEQHQTTGSFKLRGATNAILALDAQARQRGVVAVSTGNHGRALAYAAREAGVRAVVCMSRLVPANKVEAIRSLGAEIRIVGRSQDEAQQEVDRLVADEGLTLLPPFDNSDVIAGQGTLGLEILEDAPEAAAILVPLSGGGLIAGIARAAKSLNPTIRIVGITMERGCAMKRSLEAGHPVAVEEEESLADSLGGGIGLDNRHTFEMVRDLVDDCLLVSEAGIAAAMRHAYLEEQEVIEGAAAVGIALLLAGQLPPIPGTGPVVVLLSGRNVDMAQHRRVIGGEVPTEKDGA